MFHFKLRLYLVFMFVATIRYTASKVMHDMDCIPTNCSQPKRDLYEGDHDFICTIGHKNECDIAKYFIQYSNTNTNNENVARISQVALYGRTYEKFKHGAYRALNFTMVMPNENVGALGVKMIHVDFHSPAGKFMDKFYNENKRCRLFNVGASQLTVVDLDHPREISYPCLVGLSEVSPVHNYILNLTVLPYMAYTSYHLSTYTYLNEDPCISVSAIAYIHATDSFHVVFDRSLVSGVSYILKLYNKDNLIETVNTTNNQWNFQHRGPGEYKIAIEQFPSRRACEKVSTEIIKIPYEERNIHNGFDFVTVGSVMSATLFALILIIILVLYKSINNNKQSKTTLQNPAPNNAEPAPDFEMSHLMINVGAGN